MTGKDVIPYDPVVYAQDRATVEASFWHKLRSNLGRVPFLDEALAAYYCARDRETPTRVKAVLMGALAYFVVPTDIIPDFVAWVGFTDDAAVLAIAIQAVAPHIKPRHRERARQMLAQEQLDAEAQGSGSA
ncbi:MAG: YkvA family protein [Kiloniellales bacterium]